MLTAHLIKDPTRPSGKDAYVAVAGISIVRQRPGTARGVVFITLEDETGLSNLIVRPDIFERFSKIIITASALLAYGVLERVEKVVYINVHKIESLDPILLKGKESNFPVKSYAY